MIKNLFRRKRGKKHRRWISPLTDRILAVNITSLLILGFGVLYAGQYEQQLIKTELANLSTKGQLFAAAIAEGGVRERLDNTPVLVADLSIPMVRRLAETTGIRVRLFDTAGALLADSHQLVGPGGMVEITELDPPLSLLNPAQRLRAEFDRMLKFLPTQNALPQFPPLYTNNAQSFPDGLDTIAGEINLRAWKDNNHEIMLTAFIPVQQLSQVLGAVFLTQEGSSIAVAVAEVRFAVIRIFIFSLAITVMLSVYLATSIARPVLRLAAGAERLSREHGRQQAIPDFTSRQDEIGDLSGVLRAMTQAQWERMDAIENFAADVAHEIKNPLASVRSAVETLARVKTDEQRSKLMNVIQDDIIRIDRLIGDIAAASSLDAEISRAPMSRLDVVKMVRVVTEAFRERLSREFMGRMQAMPVIDLEISDKGPLLVAGNESQLGRLLENLLENAVSFSPPGAAINVRVFVEKDDAGFSVQNAGSEIPETRMEKIFERFYTERPGHEKFGSHSGLGLSICRQIIRAHQGRIFAENVKDKAGAPFGVRFTVCLPMME